MRITRFYLFYISFFQLMTFFIIIAMIREIKGKGETLSIADLPVYLIY